MTWDVGPTNLNLKVALINLNADLDIILDRVRYVRDYHFLGDDLNPNHPGLYNIELSVLFLEDRRFFIHRGAELRAIPRILRRVLSGRKAGGISTIEQQLVRTVLNKRQRTIGRKVREVILALCLDFHESKRNILRAYMADAYFGEGVNGCSAAAELVFRKTPSSLSRQEACWLAALLPHPMPRAFIERMSGTRAVWTVDQLLEIGDELVPAWSAKVNRRYSYVMRGVAGFIPRRR